MRFDEKKGKSRRSMAEFSILLLGPWDPQNNAFLKVTRLNNHDHLDFLIFFPPDLQELRAGFFWVADSEFLGTKA